MLGIGSDSRNVDMLETICSVTVLGWDLQILSKYLWGKKKSDKWKERNLLRKKSQINVGERIKRFFLEVKVYLGYISKTWQKCSFRILMLAIKSRYGIKKSEL